EFTVGPLPVGAVVVREQREADGARVDAFRDELRDENEVSAAFTHLFAFVGDHASVRVGVGPFAVVERCGVRCAHLVVREHEVEPAAVHGDGRGKVMPTNDRALNVPAWPATAYRRVPRGFALA